jgi:hypothetical protein
VIFIDIYMCSNKLLATRTARLGPAQLQRVSPHHVKVGRAPHGPSRAPARPRRQRRAANVKHTRDCTTTTHGCWLFCGAAYTGDECASTVLYGGNRETVRRLLLRHTGGHIHIHSLCRVMSCQEEEEALHNCTENAIDSQPRPTD